MRRWFGAVCLAMAAGLLIGGQTLLKARLEGDRFVCYWLLCLGFTVAAIVVAWWDVRAVRRRAQQEHRTLVEQTMQEVINQVQEQPDCPPDQKSPAK